MTGTCACSWLSFSARPSSRASLVFIVTIALQLLHLGRPGVGELEAITGVGGVIGGFLALMLAHRKRLSFDFGMGVVLWSAPLLLVALWPVAPAAFAMTLLLGVGNSIVDINAFTVLQRVVPGAVMARVFGAVESLLIAGMALGALLMPLFIATVGLRSGLAILGGVVAVAALAGVHGLNRIDRTTLAPSKLSLIANNEILGPLSESVQEQLARALIEVKVPSGQAVIEQGAPGDRFYLIESGTAEVTVNGNLVHRYGPGDSFGEIALPRRAAPGDGARRRRPHPLCPRARRLPRRRDRPQRGQQARECRRLALFVQLAPALCVFPTVRAFGDAPPWTDDRRPAAHFLRPPWGDQGYSSYRGQSRMLGERDYPVVGRVLKRALEG